MGTRIRQTAVLLALAAFLALVPTGAWTSPAPKSQKHKKEKVVYVCACLKTKSCACMTEAKTEGPCSCGTEGGPPMKGVPNNSDWAKTNRDALAH